MSYEMDLLATGDLLQSVASRMADYIIANTENPRTPDYETHMAALEARDAVDEWTELRKGS